MSTQQQSPENTETAADASAAAATSIPVQTDAPAGEATLKQLQGEAERFRDLALRSQADFENFRKRSAREKEDAVKYANLALLERLIPILDNFDLGLGAARQSPDGANIVVGFEMVARQLSDFLGQHGVEPINAEGETFDPNLHEAVAQEASETVPEGTVLRQLRRGFKLRDRLLRASTVIVSKGPA